MFHSYKGGSGKTLISSNIARILSQKYSKRVLLIETDFLMPSFQSNTPDLRPDLFLNDFLKTESEDLSDYIYPDLESDFGYIFADEKYSAGDKLHGHDQNWFFNKRNQLINAIRALNYDFIIFDTSPGMHLFTINLLTIVNIAYIVMRVDLSSLRGLNLMLEQVYNKTVKLKLKSGLNIRIIFNQIPNIQDMLNKISEIKSSLQIKFPFILSVSQIAYNAKTAYHTALFDYYLDDDTVIYNNLDKEIIPYLLNSE